ncbi:G2 M phase-specific E3 ubiquitin- ligase-like isoform X1 [Labeo rohita]|uniref:G2 M phase-specific E3 ubiquitin-ligase-like isoform X1 n=1 Tax=Labeo rohita TaxID=84645 RepID=A0A498M258_LABRO|nr:G2 M phase-specific E3 ubiquitin- ligase-like isoform X1 [Labeo rohita]
MGHSAEDQRRPVMGSELGRIVHLRKRPKANISKVGGELDSVDSSLAVMDVKVSCPVCSAMYPQDYIEVHASTCGERCEGAPNMDLNIVEQQHDKQNSRGLTQWKRQKKSSPKNPLRVTFIGEPGIDSGALMKEFLTEMMAGIEAKFFEGGKFGKNLKYSITDFQKDNFRTIGEIMAVSITQDGPPPHFFQEWIYNFISSGEINKDQLSKADVTDPDLLDLIDKVFQFICTT